MRRKYFFFDIDGTLSTGLTTTMPESAVKCLDLLRQAGHFTAIATGRLQVSAKTVADRYGFTNIVADGGWSVTIDGKILEMQSLPASECIRFVDWLRSNGIPWAISPENEKLCVTSDRNYLSLAPENYFPVLWDPRYDHHVLDHLYKVYFRCPIGEEEQMQSGELPLVRYNPEIVFVEPKEKAARHSKGAGAVPYPGRGYGRVRRRHERPVYVRSGLAVHCDGKCARRAQGKS